MKNILDVLQPNNTGYVKLNPDKEIYFGNKSQYPIWKGILNDLKIEIILKNSDSYTIESYDFIDFPISEKNLKEKIVNWIDEYINEKWK
ncbi:hypothetical protein ACFQ5N_00860 [Lutibacter holmesii]|uniref:Uncharacterized protein n=1 Tax=Lutibacter holmesii TaxID=1137985 RepID=A0ABW3WJI0_9FLAO